MKPHTAFAALAALTAAPAFAGFTGNTLNARFLRENDNFTFDNQTFIPRTGVDRVIDFRNDFDVANLDVGFASIELEFIVDPSFELTSSAEPDVRHIIRFTDVSDTITEFAGVNVSIAAGGPPINWIAADAVSFTENTIDVALNTIGNAVSIPIDTVIRLDVFFVPSQGTALVLAAAACPIVIRRRG